MDFERLSPLSLKDLMLGELLCQSGILTDSKLLEIIEVAKSRNVTIGAALSDARLIDKHELFSARRHLSNYLRDPENLDTVLSAIQCLHLRYHPVIAESIPA